MTLTPRTLLTMENCKQAIAPRETMSQEHLNRLAAQYPVTPFGKANPYSDELQVRVTCAYITLRLSVCQLYMTLVLAQYAIGIHCWHNHTIRFERLLTCTTTCRMQPMVLNWSVAARFSKASPSRSTHVWKAIKLAEVQTYYDQTCMIPACAGWEQGALGHARKKGNVLGPSGAGVRSFISRTVEEAAKDSHTLSAVRVSSV